MRPPHVRTGPRPLGAVVAVLTVAASLAIAGCRSLDSGDAGSAGESGGAADASMAASTSALETEPVRTGELTADEELSINPPPPVAVRVSEVTEESVMLTWDRPPRVTAPHRYGDDVLVYRIHRRAAGEADFRPIGDSRTTAFVDRSVTAGRSYEYVVSSVHERNVEGGRSDPAATAFVPR